MEVYGTKPKRFTKDWWEYFWDYYKLHTIAAVFVLIALISTISECAHKINYDLQVDLISENPVSSAGLEALTPFIEDNIDDVTANGKTQAYLNYIYMGEENDPQYMQAMYTKFSVEMGYTEAFVFLVSKKYADTLIDAGAFEPATNWCSVQAYRDCCVSLEGCEYLHNIGINTDDLYLGIIKMRERDKESEREKNKPKQENGIKFAKFLISER